MNWRPDNWKNPHKGAFTNKQNHSAEEGAYEAGADAILVALEPYFEKVLKVCELARNLIPDNK